MTPEEAFLCDICEHPDDDSPRLIYADWLEEHGQRDLAEFIRLQCQLDDGTGWWNHSPDPSYTARERELLESHRDQFLGPLAPVLNNANLSTDLDRYPPYLFHRGFVEYAYLTAEDLWEHGDTLFRLAPVRSLRLLPLI